MVIKKSFLFINVKLEQTKTSWDSLSSTTSAIRICPRLSSTSIFCSSSRPIVTLTASSSSNATRTSARWTTPISTMRTLEAALALGRQSKHLDKCLSKVSNRNRNVFLLVLVIKASSIFHIHSFRPKWIFLGFCFGFWFGPTT